MEHKFILGQKERFKNEYGAFKNEYSVILSGVLLNVMDLEGSNSA